MKKTVCICISIILASLLCANESAFSFGVDFAYYPESKPVPSEAAAQFAPMTGLYSGVEARFIGKYEYTIPVPFGENSLVSGNMLTLGANIELTPLTIEAIGKIGFSPIAFLNFNAGVKIGSGWELIGLQGVAEYNPITARYDSISPFSAAHNAVWIEGVFQFDLAAVVPGEWNHVVFVAAYKTQYEQMLGVENKHPWLWQTIGHKVNGLSYESSFILGYQMPLPLSMVAVQTVLLGYYNAADFAPQYTDWDPTFMTVEINPIGVITLSKKQSLLIQFSFASRRSFSQDHSAENRSVLEYTQTGREWYFRRLALSYSHKL